MDQQLPQRFCTNCGHPLAPGTAFCVECGTPVSAVPTDTPEQFSAGAQSSSPPPFAQAPTSSQEDLLIEALAAGALARQMGRRAQPQTGRRSRRRRSGLSGCGCLLLVLVILALLAGPFVGVALTTGRLHQLFIYVAGGMVVLFLLVVLIGMLATKGGRESLVEMIFEGLFGGS